MSSFKIINFVKPDPVAAVFNPNGIKTFLANSLSTCPIKHNPDLSNGPNSLPKNALDFLISCS